MQRTGKNAVLNKETQISNDSLSMQKLHIHVTRPERKHKKIIVD